MKISLNIHSIENRIIQAIKESNHNQEQVVFNITSEESLQLIIDIVKRNNEDLFIYDFFEKFNKYKEKFCLWYDPISKHLSWEIIKYYRRHDKKLKLIII